MGHNHSLSLLQEHDRLILRLTKNQAGIELNCTKEKMGNREGEGEGEGIKETSSSLVLELKSKVPTSLARGECEACGR